MSARLLLADDDRAIREALVRALALEGYDVVQAADGAPIHAVPSPWQKGDVVRAVAEFVDDLVDEPVRDLPGD